MDTEKNTICTKCVQITAICVLVLLFISAIVYLVSDDDEDKHIPKKIVPSSPTTFTLCEGVFPRKHMYYNSSERLTSDPSKIIKPLVNRHEFFQVLQSSSFPETSFLLSGLVRTVVDCHNFHHNLIIRPDDVWAAIMSQFSWYASKNGAKLGKAFATYQQEGRQIVQFEASGNFATLPYDGMMFSFKKNIELVFKEDSLWNWILPDFTTTTENDLVTIGLMFMGSMETVLYKRTKNLETQCGIPHVTLDGTVADWIEIRDRSNKLNQYGLEKWNEMLNSILTHFVKIKEWDNDNVEFWKEMVKVEELDYHYVTGWITAFCVFQTLQGADYGGEKQPQNQYLAWLSDTNSNVSKKWPAIIISDVPSGVSAMNAKIVKRDENGKIYKGLLLAGHMAAELKEDGESIQPILGWAMTLQRGRNG